MRGTGVTQVIYGTGFQPGESVSGTLHSTSIPLAATTADPSGNVSWNVPIGADFEVGSHSADLIGTVSGEVTAANNHTQFTVLAAAVPSGGSGSTGGTGLASTGSDLGWAPPALLALFIAGGGALLIARRKRVKES